MDSEQKKEYLREYEHAVRQMQRSELRIKEIRLNKMCPATTIDGMPYATEKKDLSEYVVMLEQEERRYEEAKCQRIRICGKIINKIENLESENEKDVLMYRYVKLLKWEVICAKMNFSWKGIHKLHGRALMHLEIL